MENNISIMTGGPGTGKSNTIIRICNHFNKNKIPFKILSPTGTSSQSLKDALSNHNKKNKDNEHNYGDDIMTIDKFIKMNDNLDNRDLQIEMIVIDEFSMVGLKKFNQLIRILNLVRILKKIIIVGDPNQLPSIQIGNILHDFINYGIYEQENMNNFMIQKKKLIPCATLTTVHRTDCDEIMQITNAIVCNTPEKIIGNTNDKFKYFNNLSNIYQRINSYKNEIHNTMLLIHTNKGDWGCDVINKEISNILVPTNSEYNGFKIKDRIICTKNGLYDTDKNLNNGDIFYMDNITQNPLIFHLSKYKESSEIIKINQTEISHFKLAWAISIHKSQGKEWNNVIVMIPNFNIHMLNRNLLYTATTRCKKECNILCESDSLLIKCLRNTIQLNPTILQIDNIFHRHKLTNHINENNNMTKDNQKIIPVEKKNILYNEQKITSCPNENNNAIKDTRKIIPVKKIKILHNKHSTYVQRSISDFFK